MLGPVARQQQLACRQAEGACRWVVRRWRPAYPEFDPGQTYREPAGVVQEVGAVLQHGEWFRLGLDKHIGGVPAPSMVAWAINELVLGANLAVFIYLAGRYSRTSCTGSATSNKALGWHIEGVKRFITNGDTDDLF